MSALLPTQSIAMRLINSITTKDESGLRKWTSPDIVLTSRTNGGAPIVKQGQTEYLAVIHDMWSKMIDYRYGAFLYGDFNPASGTLSFTQICVAKDEDGNGIFLGEGDQTFAFENEKITAITVEETHIRLTEEDYKETIAKITLQNNKIRNPVASNSSSSQASVCAIL